MLNSLITNLQSLLFLLYNFLGIQLSIEYTQSKKKKLRVFQTLEWMSHLMAF
jgi:hypothetical protein